MKVTMRDMDNRGDDGEPYEFTKGIESVVSYLDGPLRQDLSAPDIGGPDIDDAIALLRDGDVEGANARVNHMGVYLSKATDEENGSKE